MTDESKRPEDEDATGEGGPEPTTDDDREAAGEAASPLAVPEDDSPETTAERPEAGADDTAEPGPEPEPGREPAGSAPEGDPGEPPDAAFDPPPAGPETGEGVADPMPGSPPTDWLKLGVGAALVLIPGLILAWRIGRPLTERMALGFPTLIPGRTGWALHPSQVWFWIGVACVFAVGAGAAVILSALTKDGRGTAPPPERVWPWIRRHGWSLSLLAIAILVLFPTMGTAGLWDPWESHYGLVGLRMVEQDDWISTCDMGWTEWFFSKPILLFWLMGLGMVGLGQDAAADGNPPLVEWAFRLPIALLAIGAVMAVYLFASRRWSRRAGFLAGLALLTMPQFFFIARQAMTDMPFVAPLAVAMCCFGLAIGERPDRPAAVFRFPGLPVRFNSFHLVVVLLTAVSLPQVLVVLTHNRERALAVYKANAPAAELERLEADRAITHDVIVWGSLGQAEDGNDRCRGLDCSTDPDRPGGVQVNERFRPEIRLSSRFPGRGGVHRFWGLVFLGLWVGALLVMTWRSSPALRGAGQRDVYLYGFYIAMGVATLAKGLLGFMLPGMLILLYLMATGEWRLLLRMRILRGIVLFLAVAGPWYTMMVVRHGNAWFQQFIIHDHFKRTSGVHGDRGPLGYFVEQLGVGTFPWAAFIPAALLAFLWIRWRRERPAERSAGERAAILTAVWGIAVFAFFTVNSTKFHHYVFPALPAFALAVGLLLDRLVASKERWTSVVLLGSLAAFAFVARDLAATTNTKIKGFERLIHLFMYKYDRAWPDPGKYGAFLDYADEMIYFAAILGGLVLLLLLPARIDVPATVAPNRPKDPVSRAIFAVIDRPRRTILALLCAVAVAFAGFSLHVYFNQISPHWSEGYIVKKYYELRAGPHERLIAYSLNWHGENSYTANRAKILMTEHGFKPEWDDFPEWIKRHQGATYYFILGKGGAGGLRSKLNSAIPRSGETVEVVCGDTSNKYELARARLCAPEDCPPEGAAPYAVPIE
jgi:4-amino-4-deoxy-L-arabinose transferase-like glycosyltransferase